MTAIAGAVAFAIGLSQVPLRASAGEKKAFIELVKTLPSRGEFFTEAAVERAAPYIRVLFALTQKDIENYSFYPFAALSYGFVQRKELRHYGVKYFGNIAHPEMKLFWAVLLFNADAASPEVRRHLRDCLKSKEQARELAMILGPDFEDFKKRLDVHP